MKLLTQTTAKGITQVCDRRCYASKPGGRCGCVCGGRNHAVGIDRALENIRTLFMGEAVPEKVRSTKGIPKVTRAAMRAMRRQEELAAARERAEMEEEQPDGE